MTEIRCVKCNRLLMKYDLDSNKHGIVKVEVKCPKCGFLGIHRIGLATWITPKAEIEVDSIEIY